MIGHVFTSSGANTLAIAPSSRTGDYLVLATYEGDQYAVASLAVDRVIEAGGAPDHWMEGSYFDDLDDAIENFGIRTGIPVDLVAKQVRYAAKRVAAMNTAPIDPRDLLERPYAKTSPDGKVTRLTRHEMFDDMQRHHLRYSELAAHIQDVNAGYAVSAEDGTTFTLAEKAAEATAETDPARH